MDKQLVSVGAGILCAEVIFGLLFALFYWLNKSSTSIETANIILIVTFFVSLTIAGLFCVIYGEMKKEDGNQ